MVTNEEYFREKGLKEAAEQRVRELEAELAQLRGQNEVPQVEAPAWDESEDAPE